MFIQVEQGTKHPEASPWHRFTQMFAVVIGYPRNYQIRVIKLIRGSNILKYKCITLISIDIIFLWPCCWVSMHIYGIHINLVFFINDLQIMLTISCSRAIPCIPISLFTWVETCLEQTTAWPQKLPYWLANVTLVAMQIYPWQCFFSFRIWPSKWVSYPVRGLHNPLSSMNIIFISWIHMLVRLMGSFIQLEKLWHCTALTLFTGIIGSYVFNKTWHQTNKLMYFRSRY